MNKEEIKKALDCCSFIYRCHDCPYEGKSECSGNVNFDALELIKAQEAEIEILKNENSDLVKEYRKKVLEEFADKLKDRFHNYYPSVNTYCISTKAVSYEDLFKTLREFENE